MVVLEVLGVAGLGAAYVWLMQYNDDAEGEAAVQPAPLCLHCNPELRNLRMENPSHAAVFSCPMRCLRCTTVWTTITSFGCVTREAVEVRIDSAVHRVVLNFSALKAAQPKKDVWTALVNQVDAHPGSQRFYQLHLLQAYLPMILKLQGTSDRHPWFRYTRWNNHTASLRLATLFRPIGDADELDTAAEEPADPAASSTDPVGGIRDVVLTVNTRLSGLWQYIRDHGTYPVQTSISRLHHVFDALCSDGRPPSSEHAETLAVAGEPAPYLAPPPGLEVVASEHQASVVVGPVGQPLTVHDPRCIADIPEGRMLVRNDPRTGEPLSFKADSVPARGVKACWKKFHNAVLTKSNCVSKLETVFDGKSLGDFAVAKFGAERMQAAASSNDLVRSADDIHMRKLNGKWEVIAKDNKPIRGVCDHGIEAMALGYAACKVLEELTYGHGAVFESCSIKHRNRRAVLDDVVWELAKPRKTQTAIWEIDQTAMEMHERSPGNLDFVVRALQQVINHISDTYHGSQLSKYSCRLSHDKRGLVMTVKVMVPTNPGGKKMKKLKSLDLYLDSGWLLTSLTNFLNEMFGCLSCFFNNPEHILAQDKDGKFLINAPIGRRKFNFMFKPLSAFKDVPKQVLYVPFHEGDDGIGIIDRRMVSDENKALFENYQCDLGFCGKFKAIVDGRAEYIGAHFLVREGRLDESFPWVPDVRRYLGKTGVHTQNRANITDEERAAAAAARFFSLAEMFNGRLDCMYQAFHALAVQWSRRCRETTRVLVDHEWTPEAYALGMGVGYHIMGELEEVYRQFPVLPTPTTCVQNALLLNSLELEASEIGVVGRLCMWAEDVKVRAQSGEVDHLATWSCLPLELRGGAN